MKSILTLQEIAISLSSSNRKDMTDINKFQEKKIIPNDWIISRSSAYAEDVSQMIFNNGLRIIAKPNMVTFLEPLKFDSFELKIPEVSGRYVRAFEASFREVVIDVRSFITFDGGDTKSAYEYLKKLLLFNYELSVNAAPSQIDISLIYNFEECQLILKIGEVKLDIPGGKVIPAILLSSRFLYEIPMNSPQKNLNYLFNVIDQSNTNLKIHRDFLHSTFEIENL